MTANCTAEQLESLLHFLDEHRDLARGRLRNVDGRAESRRLWGQLAEQLNALGGSNKTVQQWQKVWCDKKYNTKRAAAALRASHSATGGGPSVLPALSQTDLKILEIMGDGFGEPQTSASVDPFPSNAQPNQSQELLLPPTEENLLAESSQQESTVSQESAVVSSRQRATPRSLRRSQRRSDDSVRGRFFRLEDRRLQLEERMVQLEERRLQLEERRVQLEERHAIALEGLIHLARLYFESFIDSDLLNDD